MHIKYIQLTLIQGHPLYQDLLEVPLTIHNLEDAYKVISQETFNGLIVYSEYLELTNENKPAGLICLQGSYTRFCIGGTVDPVP